MKRAQILPFRKVAPAFAVGALCLAILTPALASNGRGVHVDLRNGLSWTEDPGHVVSQGLSDKLVVDRGEALKILARLNAGEAENYGVTTWRLPTVRELLTKRPDLLSGAAQVEFDKWLRLQTNPVPTKLAGSLIRESEMVFLWAVKGEAVSAGLEDAVLLATNSAQLNAQAQIVSGDVVVNDVATTTSVAGSGHELRIDNKASTPADYAVKADSILLNRRATVGGDLYCNNLDLFGGGPSTSCAALGLPVFDQLPAFNAATPGTTDVVVAEDGFVALPEGAYGDVTVLDGGTLVLGGGTYDMASLDLKDEARLEYADFSDVRVAGILRSGTLAYIGPQDGSGLDGSDAAFHVGGTGTSWIGAESVAMGNFYVPNGQVVIQPKAAFSGSVIAQDVVVKTKATMTLDSLYGNQAPTAFPQTVAGLTGVAVEITLEGFDPEGGDLTFSILSGPTGGTLSAITPIVPAPYEDRDTGEIIQPPITSATVYYTSTDGAADSFTFQVTDDVGNTGSAVVTILEDVTEEPPPPPTTVTAEDLSDTIPQDTTVTVSLNGGAPEGVDDLTFSIVSGPTNGTLTALIPVDPVVTPIRSATAEYTPDEGFVGTDSFVFEVCDDATSSCDQGTVTIEVTAVVVVEDSTVDDQSFEIFRDTSLQFKLAFTIGGTVAESHAPALKSAAKSTFSVGAKITGNVADSNADFLGDNKNDLPGPSPTYVSVFTGGTAAGTPAGDAGTGRIQMEWDLSLLNPSMVIDSASVVLNIRRGASDTEATVFLDQVGNAGNGLLDLSDYEAFAVSLGSSFMPVTVLASAGDTGTFSFDVSSTLITRLSGGGGFLALQARSAFEGFPTTTLKKGLDVNSTADGNLASGLEPQLMITSSSPITVLTVTLTSLPANGTLYDAYGEEITATGAIPNPNLTYVPDTGFTGVDTVGWQLDDGLVTPSGTVTINVVPATCETDPSACGGGR